MPRVANQKCAACLWRWEDVHDPSSGRAMCYNRESPMYRRERPLQGKCCGSFEHRLKSSVLARKFA